MNHDVVAKVNCEDVIVNHEDSKGVNHGVMIGVSLVYVILKAITPMFG